MDTKDIQFDIINIEILQFNAVDDLYIEDVKDEISLGAGFKFGIDNEKKTFIIFNEFQFFQNSETSFLSIEASCEFSISDKFWESFKNDDNVVIPMEFVQHLAMMSIGTTRGLLQAKVAGTRFKSFILPVIYVDKIIKNDVIFDK